jgi:hypothetical protein
MDSGLSRRTFLKGAGAGLGLSALAVPAGASGLLGAAGGSKLVGANDVLRLARVWYSGLEEATLLSTFDDTHHVYDDGSVEVLLWPGDLARLQATNLRYEITVEDVIARDQRALRAADQAASFSGSVPGARDDYRVLAEFEEDLLGLVAAHPDKARLIVLSEQSREGRPIIGIEIADDVDARDGRPVWYMDGLHHAREWPSGELTLFFAYELLQNPEDDERIAGLRRDTRTILVPVVNPDGFSWSRSGLVRTDNYWASLPFAIVGQDTYWRKNRYGANNDAVLPVVQRNPTAYGVDINRNYSARWGGPGAGAVPAEQTYRGPNVFSEPEPRAVAALLRERQPVALNSNHTYTGLVLRPWGHGGGGQQFSPDEGLMRDLGAAMCRINGYRNWHSIDLYATTGTTVDWGYAAIGAISYTYEIGFSNFYPAYAGNDGPLAHYQPNREPFILLGETARYTEVTHLEHHSKTPASGGAAPGDPITYGTHSVITGRAVDADGNPVAAELVAERDRVRREHPVRVPRGAGGRRGRA